MALLTQTRSWLQNVHSIDSGHLFAVENQIVVCRMKYSIPVQFRPLNQEVACL